MIDFINKLSIQTQFDHSSSVWRVELLISLGGNLEQIKVIYEKDGIPGLDSLKYRLFAANHKVEMITSSSHNLK